VIERALDLLIERTLKQRFAQTKRARLGNSASCADPKTSTRITETPEVAPDAARQRRARRGHIANATKREIVARDGLRCTFVGRDGLRCGATRFTQIHHEQPWARGGEETPGNLRLLCAAHNQLLAERDFGKELVASRIHHRRVAPRAQSADAPQTGRRISRSSG
jgi:hypothetical protein